MIQQFKHISVKTKILLFSFLLIVLPSGMLGYFGFQSIDVRGKRLQDNYRSLARLTRDKLEGDLILLERTFIKDVTNRNWDQDIQDVRQQLAVASGTRTNPV